MQCIAKKTLEVAKEKKNDVIVQVKENQPTLLNDIRTISTEVVADQIYQAPIEHDRNRIEVRTIEVFEKLSFSDPEKWELVEAIVKVERIRDSFETKTKSWKHEEEISYYIATTVLEAQQFCSVIRNHWGIENRNHYTKDVSMGEDASRIRRNPGIMARLKSFSLNIMRANKVKNISKELFENALDMDRILNYTGININQAN